MSRSSTGRWLLAGLSAGLALTATILVVRLWLGVPSLPEQIQDQLLLLIPGSVSSFVLQRLEFTAKPLLFTGSVAVMVLAGGPLGIVFGRVQQRAAGRVDLARPVPSAGVGLSLWLLVLLALLPLAGARSILDVDSVDRLDVLVMLLVPGAAFGLTLGRVGAALNARPASAAPGVAGFRIDRRALIAVGLPVAGTLVTAGSVERIIREMHQNKPPPPPAVALTIPAVIPTLSPVPQPTPTVRSTATRTPAAGPTGAVQPTPASAPPTPPPTPMPTPSPTPAPIPESVDSRVTPLDEFYLVSKNFVDPTLNADDWSLEVFGLVDTPLTLTYADVLALPAASAYVTLECISNRVGGNLMGTALWTGAPLLHLLSAAGVRSDATAVAFTSADNYVESYPLQTAMAATTILAYAMNGEPLPYRHGYPLRLLSVGHYGMKNPKWLRKIELTSEETPGYWTQRGWNPDSPVRTTARIQTPRGGASVPFGPIAMGGLAFAGDRGIATVELSADDGATWFSAVIEEPLSPYTWVRWVAHWTPAATGKTVLSARATEQDGTPQIAESHVPFPDGATGYHRVTLTLE